MSSEADYRQQAEELLGFFNYRHLPDELQLVSKSFRDLAVKMDAHLVESGQKVLFLRKLLEAKDCAVRAEILWLREEEKRQAEAKNGDDS